MGDADIPSPNTTVILDTFRQPLWENDSRFTILQGGGGSGKAVPSSTKVITPDGFKRMGDIQVGDIICNVHSGTTIVTNKYHPGKKQMYKITFDDHRESVACEDHLWSCQVIDSKETSRCAILSTKEIYDLFGDNILSIPISDPVYHTKKDLPIDPYLVGLLISDEFTPNSLSELSVISDNIEVENWLCEHGYLRRSFKNNNVQIHYLKNISLKSLVELDLAGKRLWEKKIPNQYLYSSIGDRFELLRGLLDANGMVDDDGNITYRTTSMYLSEDISQLVRSLGGKCTVRHIDKVAYILHIRFKGCTIPVFKDKRKQGRVKSYDDSSDMRLRIISIDKVECDEEIYCIEVDADDKLFLIDDYVVTHNSHAICQYLCYLFLTQDDVIIAVIRESMPILKKSVYMGDPSIVRTLRDWKVPVDDWWNKTDTTITNPLNRSEFRFIGLDSSEKIKSQNWNYCWIEEATELSLEKWSQCNTRMRRPNKHGPDRMIISYNPINIYNWVIQQFVVNPSAYIKDNSYIHFSNFLDNPFLPKDVIVSMMDTAERDENYYWTYVIGKPGVPVGQIYTNFKFTPREGVYEENPDGGEAVEVIPPWPKGLDDVIPYYGIDFGYIDPMVVVEIKEFEGKYYVRNLFYEPKYTTNQFIEELRKLGIDSNHMLYCDSAEQDRISQLGQEGFCPNNAAKDRHAGITYLKGLDIIVDSTGKYGEIARGEVQGYMWDKDKNDPRILLDEPAKNQQDHFCLAGDSLITTRIGDICIKDILEGDEVLTRQGFRKVIAWAKTSPSERTVDVITWSGKTLRCTPDHKIWSESQHRFTPAAYLRSNEEILVVGKDGKIQSDNVSEVICATAIPVYNITVEDAHEYFANGILVSNCDALRYGIFTHHLLNTEFSTIPLDMGDGTSVKRSSADILKEMSGMISKF